MKQESIGEIFLAQIHDYLEKHEFEGLYNDDLICGCGIDDLAPCGNLPLNCISGVITHWSRGVACYGSKEKRELKKEEEWDL